MPAVDGLGPRDKDRLVKAIREVWMYSEARRICLKRSIGEDGFPRCENPKCKSKGKAVPKNYADHIVEVGAFDEGFISRMFIPSNQLQALCKKCHDAKTYMFMLTFIRKQKK